MKKPKTLLGAKLENLIEFFFLYTRDLIFSNIINRDIANNLVLNIGTILGQYFELFIDLKYFKHNYFYKNFHQKLSI